MNSDTWIQI